MLKLCAVAVVLACVAIGASLLAVRALRRRRAARSLRMESREGIVEERFVSLGGVEQWIGIRGEDRANPVLLILHGGPGSPYSVMAPLLRGWEKHFTLVQWDRRGVGKTLGRNGKAGCGEMSFDRMVDDAIALAEYLRERFPSSPLVVLSSSMGTRVGLPLVQRRPELFAAYVGTDLNVSMTENTRRSYAAALAWARRTGHRRAAEVLERMGPEPRTWTSGQYDQFLRLKEKTVTVGPTVSGFFLPLILTSPLHGLGDVLDVLSGLGFSNEALFHEFFGHDESASPSRFELPFFVFHGDSDAFTTPELAEAYVASVEAPRKHFELIRDAGHLGAFAQPDVFLSLLRTHVLPVLKPGASPRMQALKA